MKVTKEMLAAAEEQSKKNGKGLLPMQPLTRDVWIENISAIFKAMLSAAPTPPEVEPVGYVTSSFLRNACSAAEIRKIEQPGDIPIFASPPEVEPIPDDLRMDAYYYGFSSTGVSAIDKILSAVACAGKAYHHTVQWPEVTPPYRHCTGESPVEWIQNAANEAAKFYTSPPSPKAEWDAPDSDWLWFQLMDWCKKRGFHPGDNNDLFAIVGKAREYNSTQKEVAQYAADGTPLNLLAAARDLCERFDERVPALSNARLNNLRKFIKDES